MKTNPRSYPAGSKVTVLQFSTTPRSGPAKTLRRLPTQAITPALLGLLDIMSSPLLLIEERPAGELVEMPPVEPWLPEAA